MGRNDLPTMFYLKRRPILIGARITMWFGVGILLASCSSPQLMEDKTFDVVPFRMIAARIPVVKATLNNKDAWFVVDTGASATLLNMGVAKDFDISLSADYHLGETRIDGLAGSLSFGASTCKIRIGQLTMTHTVLKSNDMNGLFALINKHENLIIAGIIGSDLLLRYGVNINYADRTISYRLKNRVHSLPVQSVVK